GDIVVSPYKPDSTINIGVVTGDYEFVSTAEVHQHRRRVEWKQVGLSRTAFSQAALYAIGSMCFVFKNMQQNLLPQSQPKLRHLNMRPNLLRELCNLLRKRLHRNHGPHVSNVIRKTS